MGAGKNCTNCKVSKPRCSFPVFRQAPDGLFPRCWDCHWQVVADGRRRYEAAHRGWSLSAAYRLTCRETHGPPELTTCYLCGEPNDAAAWVDHLVPQSRAATYRHGDIHAPHNLRWTHAVCNMRRGDRSSTAAEVRRLLSL